MGSFVVPQNTTVVVAGRRRFTLFPLEQFDNLYLGPLDSTLAGQPISTVHLDTLPGLQRTVDDLVIAAWIIDPATSSRFQNCFGSPACLSTAFAVCRDLILESTGKLRFEIGLYHIS